MVANSGKNCAKAINFCMSEWENGLVPQDECFCKTDYSDVQALFNFKARKKLFGKGTGGKLCFDTAGTRFDFINSRKCSGHSVGLVFIAEIFLQSFSFFK